jgi:hypothetical protein
LATPQFAPGSPEGLRYTGMASSEGLRYTGLASPEGLRYTGTASSEGLRYTGGDVMTAPRGGPLGCY